MVHPYKSLKSEADWQGALALSGETPVFVFKHSSTCPISAHAWREFQSFLKAHPDAPAHQVLVIEDRPLSQQIARETAITHQSPQALLLKAGRVVWNASHGDITRESLAKAYLDSRPPSA